MLIKIIVFGAILVSLFLGGYLVELVDRTSYLEHATSIGLDVIFVFHILSVLAVSCFTWGLIKKAFSRTILISALVFILFVYGSFVSLNVSGNIWEITKESPSNLIEYIGVQFERSAI